MDDGVVFLGHGFQDGGNQVRARRQGYVFLGSGADGPDRRLGVVADATGDDGQRNPFRFQGFDESADIERHVDHHQVGALADSQRRQAGIRGVYLFDPGAALNSDLAGGADLAF